MRITETGNEKKYAKKQNQREEREKSLQENGESVGTKISAAMKNGMRGRAEDEV